MLLAACIELNTIVSTAALIMGRLIGNSVEIIDACLTGLLILFEKKITYNLKLKNKNQFYHAYWRQRYN